MKKTILFSILLLSGCVESAESRMLNKLSVGDCIDIEQLSSTIRTPGETVTIQRDTISSEPRWFGGDSSITFNTPDRSKSVMLDAFQIHAYKGSNKTCTIEFEKEILVKKKKITEIGVDYIEIDNKNIIPVGKISEIIPHNWKEFSTKKIKEKRIKNEWRRQFPEGEEEILKINRQNDIDGQNPEFIKKFILLHLVK